MRVRREPQTPLPGSDPGLTAFLSRPRHRFFEAPSSGRRTKFSHVMWASENSGSEALAGYRAEGQGSCASPGPLVPPGVGEPQGSGRLGQYLEGTQ